MKTFLRRISILELLRTQRAFLATEEILTFLVNEGYLDDELPHKTLMRMVQRDLIFLLGEEDEEGIPDNEFGLERIKGEGRSIKWRLDPYNDLTYDFEKMPQNMAIAFAMTQKHLSDLLPRNTHKELSRLFSAAEMRLSHSGRGLSPKDFSRFKDSIEFYQRGQSLQAAQFDMTHLDTIYRAIIQRKQIGFEYRGKRYRVNPLGVAILLPKLYLIAIKNGDSNEIASCRRFLIHKIDSVWLETSSLVLPEGFSMDEYLKAGNMDVYIDANDEAVHQLELKVLPGNDRLIEDLTESPISMDQIIEPLSDGGAMLRAGVRRTIQLRNWLLSVASVSEVLASPEIRRDVLNFLKRSVSQYNTH
ncbi:helix-turn-helix transcriptional regulator [Litoribrevibacter albus]|uniref:WYL domain-containing protein n=1 Tax=Litoribrevibacter albus TaxID=1473156 RepID=A0AA37SBQ8_9GAMM|nr:WYL domain-containing protein [Litoribrevibacter albus]GLQ31592.1 hypothetical protein GCM10007876_20710 [Litoribrevibacter albus]